MKNRFIIIYSVFASLIFVFSICFFGYNLYSEYSFNQNRAAKKYKYLVATVDRAFSNQEQTSEQALISIKKMIGDGADFSYIEIKEDNNSILLYPTGTKKKETESKLTKPFQSSIKINDTYYQITANIYLIKPSSVYYYARTSFLIVLIITVITIIMIVYIGMTESKSEIEYEEEKNDQLSEENKYADSDEDYLKDDENATIDLNDEQSISDKNDDMQTEATSETAIETTKEIDCLEQKQEADESLTKTEDVPQLSSEKTQQQSEEYQQLGESQQKAELPYAEVEPLEIKENNSPSGLFDPETGIGWELYLMTRLDNEIDRAIASEIDLSIFVIKISGENHSTEKFKNVCNYLSIQFQFKDLIFEYKDDCIVCIKLSTDIEEALIFADKIYEDISDMIEKDRCNIGISSRSIRIVSGERILLEATQALEHSLREKDSPVIAFKVDSEKYRKFLEQN